MLGVLLSNRIRSNMDSRSGLNGRQKYVSITIELRIKECRNEETLRSYC